jgi:hypothetical protein
VSNYESQVSRFAVWLGHSLITATVHEVRALIAHRGEQSPFVANMAGVPYAPSTAGAPPKAECANIA